MSKQIEELSDATFENAVNHGVTLVDFWAPWCGPCHMQTPVLESVATTVGAKATIAKVNVDQSMGLAQRFGVQSIPTLLVLKDGTEVKRFVGVQSEGTLIAAIEDAA